jgi:hypothetical protein
MSWCSVHLRRFGGRCQLRRGTGNNSWFQNDGAQTCKLIAHITTDYCTLKFIVPQGLRDCRVPVATATMYEGLHHLSLRAAVDILRYAGCGPASPVDEARPKTYCKYNGSVECPLLKFLHKEVGNHMGRQRMLRQSSHLFLET